MEQTRSGKGFGEVGRAGAVSEMYCLSTVFQSSGTGACFGIE